MVHTPIDPIRVPSITQSPKEIAEMQEMIEAGQLPKDFIKRHADAVDANVFGVDAPKDRKGFRLEQGLGSAKNQTANSIAAYKKYCDPKNPKAIDPDPNFDENLKRMEAELRESEAERSTKAGTGFHYGRR